MSNYNSALLAHSFGLAALAAPTDWWVGLYSLGGDPYVDLFSCEIAVPRISLVGNIQHNPVDTNSLTNITEINFGLVPTVTIQGWFITNGQLEMNVGWIGTLPSPLAARTGDTVKIATGGLVIGLSTTSIAAPPDGGGGPPPAG